MKRALKFCVPNHSPLLYQVCRQYVSLYNGENDDDMETNGELRFMRRALLEARTVFDVGSNVGDWATRALGINPRIQLHCFEPSAVTFQRLMAHRFPPHVVRNNFGLSSAPHDARLLVFGDGAGINSLYRRDGLEDGWGIDPQEREEHVHLDTLGAYCDRAGIREIDFVKVDVEGHELEVFKGMQDRLAPAQIKVIQFEYGGCNIDARVLLKDIFEFFRPYDYALYKIYPRTLQLVERYDQRLETFQYQNWAVIERHQAASIVGASR